MTFRTLIRRSLRHHWRSHLGVVLGAAIGSAALIGALVVGDSVKGSLREQATQRLGRADLALAPGDRFFEANLGTRLPGRWLDDRSEKDTFTYFPGAPGVALQLPGVAANESGAARANHVNALGVFSDADSGHGDFWSFRTGGNPLAINPGEVWLNAALANQLQARIGETIVLRVRKPDTLSAETPLTPKSDTATVMRLRFAGIVSPEQLGNFSLRAAATVPFNAFVNLGDLQKAAQLEGRANLLLGWSVAQTSQKLAAQLPPEISKRLPDSIAGSRIREKSGSESAALANEELADRISLADLQVSLKLTPDSNHLALTSPRIFLDAPMVRAALTNTPPETSAKPLLTYIASLIQSGTNATPYSMVTAAGPPWTPTEMRDNEIVISQWLADDLHAKTGDAITLIYFDPESGARLLERTNSFRVRSVVPMEMPWSDRTLMPDFPGIEKAESTSDWDGGFPLVHKIRDQDEDYWKKHKGTPKAFVTLAAGKKMWGNRFGELTAIRFPVSTNPESYRVALEQKILANLKPEELGLRFEPVREQALQGVEKSQPFDQLFLGFSFFLILAALLLMALLFQFGMEQRAPEVGTLLALGFTPRQVRKLLLREGVALAFIGGILGALGGVWYAKAMLHGLNTVWREAVGTATLSFHVTPQTMAIGLFASVIVSAITIWLTLRKFVRRPARELLVGEIGTDESKVRSLKSKVIGAAALLAGVALAGWAIASGDTANPGIFFGAGSLVLIAGLFFASARLAGLGGAPLTPSLSPSDGERVAEGRVRGNSVTLSGLALRGCARRRKRSLATVTMLACGSFLIVSIGVFRLDANRDSERRNSGTGGFALIGETTMPVVHDLNTQSGREFFALNDRELEGVSVFPFRVRAGDEASCLNLNAAQRPRLLGLKSDLLLGRFTFTKLVDAQMKEKPWAALKPGEFYPKYDQPLATNEVAAIGDANSIQWAMHKKVGATIDYVDERGQPFKVRIVGAVANSILQGQLIIDEAEFIKRFPGESGYRMFLLDAPSNSVAQVSAHLSRALQDVGLELTPAAQRLAQFNAVQNTYLGTFQVLGGLGLLLGSAGLGIVVLRNVLERRGELAVLMAMGFRKPTLQRLLLIENGALLLVGLTLGVVAAAIAVMPALLSPSAQLPLASLAVTLAAVLVNGAIWTWAATRFALRGNLLAALRNE